MSRKHPPTTNARLGKPDEIWENIKKSSQELQHDQIRSPRTVGRTSTQRIKVAPQHLGGHRQTANAIDSLQTLDHEKSFGNKLSDKDILESGCLNRRDERRLISGKFKPERIIDLHGMRVSEVGKEVSGCIAEAYLRTQRTVKIITGKGERKVYHAVRNLLNEAKAKKMVIAVSHAPKHQGGDGVFLVRIRRYSQP